MTNGDKLRQMTDEELAKFLSVHGRCTVCAWQDDNGECGRHVTCNSGVIEWLKQEVSDERNAEV